MKSTVHMQHKIVIVIFIASLLLYALYVTYNYNQIEKFGEGTPQVALFFANWCGHCRSYENSKTFDKTFALVNADTTMKGKVQFIKYDYDLNKDLANKFGINAFPSIVSIDGNGNKKANYTDDIYSSVKLVDFARQAIVS